MEKNISLNKIYFMKVCENEVSSEYLIYPRIVE